MLYLALGGVILFAFLFGLRAFERASVGSVKLLFVWVVALGGLSLALIMILTGRAGGAIAAGSLLLPLIWEKLRGSAAAATFRPFAQAMGGGASRPPPPRGSGMTREEAYAVLGIAPGATEAEIRAAHKRLMRAAHPDNGGSDWVAARINQARDVLLGRRRA